MKRKTRNVLSTIFNVLLIFMLLGVLTSVLDIDLSKDKVNVNNSNNNSNLVSGFEIVELYSKPEKIDEGKIYKITELSDVYINLPSLKGYGSQAFPSFNIEKSCSPFTANTNSKKDIGYKCKISTFPTGKPVPTFKLTPKREPAAII